MSKRGFFYGKGVNDMPRGWIKKTNEWNYRVYNVWKGMIQRCYSEKYPTYKDCTVCNRWLYLSNFVEDIVKIDNYEYWKDNPNQKISLDKDIKSNGLNKCYCLENCMFVSHADNMRQAMSTRDNECLRGEKNGMYDVHRYGKKSPHHKKIISVDPFTKQIVFTWQYQGQATDFFGLSVSALNPYLKGKAKKGHLYNGFLWYYAEEYEQMNK